MVENNRFSGLGDKLDESEDDEDDVDETESEPVETTPPAPSEPDTDPIEEPAFEFSATDQRPLYARPEAWDTIEDALELDVERALRSEHDVRNASKSELHDALLHVAADHADEIAEQVVDRRLSQSHE